MPGLEALRLDRFLLLADDLGQAVLEFSLYSGGVCMRLIRRREPASSMRSMALSGR